MKKIGIATLASLAVNVILSLWLVNQYFYDQYFHAYVDAALGPVYPFIVLTAGLGGGSSLGYLLLKRRHAGDGTGRIEKAKLFKSSGPVQPAASQSKILPTGPPPGQVSRHTAYAVPPLPKSSSSSAGSRGAASSSISAAPKVASSPPPPPSTSQTLDRLSQTSTSVLNSTLRDQFRPESAPRSFSPNPPPTVSRVEGPPPINRIPPDSSKMGLPQQWKPEPTPAPDRGFDSTVFPRPSQAESKPESSPYGSPMGQAPKPPQASQTPFPVSKWAPPDQKGETQWTDPVPKPGLAAPQKWSPPQGQGFGPRPPPQGAPPRPGAGPAPGPTGQRPPYPPGQGPLPPRPLGFPAPTRPGQPGPIGVLPPFRSDQPRPPGPPAQGRPMPPPGGSLPQPWSPQKSADKPQQDAPNRDFASESARPPQFGPTDNSRTSAEKNPETAPAGGEMDWDTALDTILKTLKKDRGVGEKS